MIREIRNDLLLVPRVIPARHHVNAVLEQIVGDVRREAEAGRRVFRVGDDEINLMPGDNRRQPSANELAARAPDDVTDKKDSDHWGASTAMGIACPRRSPTRGNTTRN